MISTPDQLFRERYGDLVAIAVRVLGNHEDAEDCVQDAFIAICGSWDRRDPAKTAAWAGSVVWNEALEILRRRRTVRRGGDVFTKSAAELLPCEEPKTASHEGMVFARIIITRASRRLTTAERLWLAKWVTGERVGQNAGACRARMKLRSIIG